MISKKSPVIAGLFFIRHLGVKSADERGINMIRSPVIYRVFLAAVLCVPGLSTRQAEAQVYKSVDEKGRVIFTDTRPEDRPSEVIKVAEPNTVTAVAGKADSFEEPENTAVEYGVFYIASPSNNEALDFNITEVNVSVAVEPPLQEGHVVQFYLDGKSCGKAGTALSRHLTGLERGAHTVEARLRDKKGKMLMSTGLVNIFVRRSGDLQNSGGDWEYDYPYNRRGFRGPRGAGSAGGVGEPDGVSGSIGADSVEGVPNSRDRAAPVRPIHRQR